MEINDFILKEGARVKDGTITWRELAIMCNNKFGTCLTSDAVRKRYKSKDESVNPLEIGKEVERVDEFETHYKDGCIEIQKKLTFAKDQIKTPEVILQAFGYDPNVWDLVEWRFGKWEVAIKDEKENRVCTTIRAKIKPKAKTNLTTEETLEVVKSILGDEIKPLQVPIKKSDSSLNNDKLMVLNIADLHLGAYNSSIDSGFDYNLEIATRIFKQIIEKTILEQQNSKSGTIVYTIGNDFINFDTFSGTTTKGTPQQNAGVMKEVYKVALELQIMALKTLREHFNNVVVLLEEGNHDRLTDYTLFLSLENMFRDDPVIKFEGNYRRTQVYKFGKTCLFFNHGDVNYKRFMQTLSAEFPREYGTSVYRYALLSHLHSEQSIIESNGITMYRLSSVYPENDWAHSNSYIGSQKKQQIFEFDKNYGMTGVIHIPISNEMLKVKKINKR